MSTKEKINALLKKHELTVKSVFVPWSQSRNAKEKSPSLNWKVTLVYKGRDILTTDYGAGYAHAPFYKKCSPFKMMQWQHDEIVRECETGYPVVKAKIDSALGMSLQDRKHPILPDSADVIYSLLMDSEVLDYGGFAEWADEFGYNSDSISDKKIYDACLEIAIRFNRLGAIIPELREAFQDY